MAQPPETNETFLREVDENLRRDQLRDFFRDNGKWLIAAVVIFLAASGGLIWWKQHQVERHEQQVEKLAQVYKDVGSGSMGQAPQQLDELASDGSKAVRASAQFARAAVALQQGDTKLATATYTAIANDNGLPQPYRNAALIRQTSLQFDQLKPEEVISRLAPLAKQGEPWFGTAGEMTAMAMIKQGNNRQAAQLFAAIARDQTVPETIRARAVQVASSLGVDAGTAPRTQAQ
ncbi:MAG TPA: tetratricopeptide repeat protein [Sphingomicrobium sp.]